MWEWSVHIDGTDSLPISWIALVQRSYGLYAMQRCTRGSASSIGKIVYSNPTRWRKVFWFVDILRRCNSRHFGRLDACQLPEKYLSYHTRYSSQRPSSTRTTRPQEFHWSPIFSPHWPYRASACSSRYNDKWLHRKLDRLYGVLQGEKATQPFSFPSVRQEKAFLVVSLSNIEYLHESCFHLYLISCAVFELVWIFCREWVSVHRDLKYLMYASVAILPLWPVMIFSTGPLTVKRIFNLKCWKKLYLSSY